LAPDIDSRPPERSARLAVQHSAGPRLASRDCFCRPDTGPHCQEFGQTMCHWLEIRSLLRCAWRYVELAGRIGRVAAARRQAVATHAVHANDLPTNPSGANRSCHHPRDADEDTAAAPAKDVNWYEGCFSPQSIPK